MFCKIRLVRRKGKAINFGSEVGEGRRALPRMSNTLCLALAAAAIMGAGCSADLCEGEAPAFEVKVQLTGGLKAAGELPCW